MFFIYGNNTKTGEECVYYCQSYEEVISRVFHLTRENPDWVYKWKDTRDAI